jgi:hypothetical protein
MKANGHHELAASPSRKEPQYPLNRRIGGPQSQPEQLSQKCNARFYVLRSISAVFSDFTVYC